MTSLSLLLWIASGIVLQLAIFLGFWRHWLDYHALRGRAAELDLPVMEIASNATATPMSATSGAAVEKGGASMKGNGIAKGAMTTIDYLLLGSPKQL